MFKVAVSLASKGNFDTKVSKKSCKNNNLVIKYLYKIYKTFKHKICRICIMGSVKKNTERFFL